MRNTGICLLAIVLGVLALSGCSHESADWKSATAADTAEAYQQFLQQHPKSVNAVQAQARIQQIAADRDWQAAAAADTRDAYEQFLAQHADSKWAQEARIRIENFAQSGGAGTGAAGPGSTTTGGAAPAAKPAATPPPAMAATPAPGAATHAGAKSKPPSHTAAGTKVASAEHGHFVQLGAFHSKARAESEWKQLAAKYPADFKSLKPYYVESKSKSGAVYKLRVGVASASDAKGLCAKLKKHSRVCVSVSG
ncbi:MAG: SPOR domain-containing protein [Steroidobacterales bacterium]